MGAPSIGTARMFQLKDKPTIFVERSIYGYENNKTSFISNASNECIEPRLHLFFQAQHNSLRRPRQPGYIECSQKPKSHNSKG